MSGLLGVELDNITFPGEAQAAYRTIGAFNAYVQDDAVIRADADRGDLAGAVAVDIGTGKGQSNYAYYQYDQALQGVIAINQNAFHAAVADARSSLGVWDWLPYAAAIVALGLIGVALYPRMLEFR